MKLPRTLGLLLWLPVMLLGLWAGSAKAAGETTATQCQEQVARIRSTYPAHSQQLPGLVDSVLFYLQTTTASDSLKELYAASLLSFLKNVNKYNSGDLLRSGKIQNGLRLIPIAFNWHRGDMLLTQMKDHHTFVMTNLSAIPDSACVHDFLLYMTTEDPDMLLRNTEEFHLQPFAISVVEQAAVVAPESARRYLGIDNQVRQLMMKSSDPRVKVLFEIFKKFGIKSAAYLQVSDIVAGNVTVETADSLGKNDLYLFRKAIALSARKEVTGSYSLRRFLENFSIDKMRKLNLSYTYAQTSAGSEFVRSLSNQELLVAVSYGYRELSSKCFQAVMQLMMQNPGKIQSGFSSVVNSHRLKNLLSLLDQNGQIIGMMALFEQSAKEEILSALTYEAHEDNVPSWYFSYLPTQPTPVAATLTADAAPEAKAEESVSDRKVQSIDPLSKVKPSLAAPLNASADLTPVPVPDALVESRVVPFKPQLNPQEFRMLSLKKNIKQTMADIEAHINESYARDLLLYAAEKEPDEVLRIFDKIKRKTFCIEVLDKVAHTAPVSVKKYLFNKMHPVTYTLAYSNDPVSAKIISINPELGYSGKPMLLLDDLVKGRLTPKEAVSIADDREKLFVAMCKILSQPQFLGRVSMESEMEYFALRAVREINDKVAQPEAQRFAAVEHYSSRELYFLMLYGREEVFKGTFRGLFDRFRQRLPASDLYGFFESVSFHRYRHFLSLCAEYGSLPAAMELMSNMHQARLMKNICTGLEKDASSLEEVIPVAQMLSAPGSPELLSQLQTAIKEEYLRLEKLNHPIGLSIYGTLVAFTAREAVSDQTWFRNTARRFNIGTAKVLPTAELYLRDRVYEQMFFYNDEDGRSSFANFVSSYRKRPEWSFEDKGSYVVVRSTDNKVMIFANKPDFEQSGMEAIGEYFSAQNITPAIVVHRGHSFYTDQTISRITSSARLIFLGSCGGFYKIPLALETAPDAQFIATRQIGTKGINDPLIVELNEAIRNSTSIDWGVFWEKLRSRVGTNPMFDDYVPPHLNLEAQFIRAYFKLLGV